MREGIIPQALPLSGVASMSSWLFRKHTWVEDLYTKCVHLFASAMDDGCFSGRVLELHPTKIFLRKGALGIPVNGKLVKPNEKTLILYTSQIELTDYYTSFSSFALSRSNRCSNQQDCYLKTIN